MDFLKIFNFNIIILIIVLSIILTIIIILVEKYFTKQNVQNMEGFDMVFNYTPNIESFQNLNLSNMKISKKYEPIKMEKYIWVYWENIKTDKHPTFIKLCIDSMKKHYGKYNLIILNEKNIHKYLPDLRKDFDNLLIAQKVDYYRIALLYKYGGIWIDADVIAINDIKPVFDKLEEGYDYVGFGCTGSQCDNGYFRPSNWVLSSRPNGILMKVCLDKLNEKLDNRNNKDTQTDESYHDYGKIIIWKSLEDLKPFGYDYYHFKSDRDGTRDINKGWIHSPNFFDTNDTEFINENNLLFVVMYNSEISNNKNYHWIKTCDESRLLNGNEWLCKLYRKALL
jgi:hypothetical protein